MRVLIALAGLIASAALTPAALSAQATGATGHFAVPPKGPTRAIVAFFDLNDLTTDQLHLTIGALATWIDTKMEPADVMAIATAGDPIAVVADYTSDKGKLRATLESFSASAAVAPANGVTTFRTMAAICNDLARTRQKRVLLFISAGLQPSSGMGEARDAERVCFGADVAINRVDPHQITIR
jgi:hypothetical protein